MRKRLIVAAVIVILGGAFTALWRFGGLDRGSAVPVSEAPASAPEEPCPSGARADWREAQTIDGVRIEADPSCLADNPAVIAAVVRGTNNAHAALNATSLARDAVVMGADLDGDGDPDEVEIRLEVSELNGFSPDLPVPSLRFAIAPGITPGLWVFSPKISGMATSNVLNNEANELLRLPSPVIRVEQGDKVRLILENTHYSLHTIHLHGVDHPAYRADGTGNDGDPMVNQLAVQPGEQYQYELQPRQTGTFFYHCHVQPQAHILMGLAGMFVVEENRPNNWVQTLNIGAGQVRHRSVASREAYDREYDLQYQDMDRELNNIVQKNGDFRRVAREMNQEYKIAERTAEYYLLNGKAFPYTLRESLVFVAPDETIKLRVLNAGEETVYLHPHGHKPTITHLDGIALEVPIMRDVIDIGPAQRADLELRTSGDGLNSDGAGVWPIHDHRGAGTTTDGIEGGDMSAIVYDQYRLENGFPESASDLSMFFDPALYRGEISMFGMMAPELYGDPKLDGHPK